MANILQLPHEVLTIIFGFVDGPKHFSMTCRSLKEFSEDPAVISSWLLGKPKDRTGRCPRLALERPVLERLVCLSDLPHLLIYSHMECVEQLPALSTRALSRELLNNLLDRALKLSKLDAAQCILEKGRSMYKDYGIKYKYSARDAALKKGDVGFLDYLIKVQFEHQTVFLMNLAGI